MPHKQTTTALIIFFAIVKSLFNFVANSDGLLNLLNVNTNYLTKDKVGQYTFGCIQRFTVAGSPAQPLYFHSTTNKTSDK